MRVWGHFILYIRLTLNGMHIIMLLSNDIWNPTKLWKRDASLFSKTIKKCIVQHFQCIFIWNVSFEIKLCHLPLSSTTSHCISQAYYVSFVIYSCTHLKFFTTFYVMHIPHNAISIKGKQWTASTQWTQTRPPVKYSICHTFH